MQGNVLGSSVRFFDIKDESQVISLLKEVRHSTLDNETKDDIRDVIFELSTNFSDTLLSELDLYVEPLGITVVSEGRLENNIEAEAKQVSDSSLASQAAIPVTSATLTSTTGRTRPAPSIGGFVSEVSKQTPQPASVSKTKVSVEVLTTPTPAPAVENPPEAQPVIEPMQEPVVENATPAQAITTEAAQTRISKIKHIVNSAVGNPVNLIDADNTVGREYMNALLEAMKSVPVAGAPLAAAMERLEAAFLAVEGVIAKTAVEPEVSNQTTPAQEVIASADTEKEATTSREEKSGYAAFVPKDSVDGSREEVEQPTAPVTTAAPSSNSVAAVAAERAMKMAAQAPKEEITSAPSDPLAQPAVTSGLEQLLSEWKLFKSSGLFGTGPSGINHPLYTTLRNMPMNLIISGRFEGATPEVRQSITDYMNGWRYEQGMTHDMQETFEHYLRRVIRAIIDKRASTVA